MIDVVNNVIKEGMLQEIFYADDIDFMAETMELREKIYSWKSAFESMDIKVSLVKTKVMVSKIGHIKIKPCSKKKSYGICRIDNSN